MSSDRFPRRHWRRSLTTRVMLITGGLVVGTALILSALAVYLLNGQVEQGARARLDVAAGTAQLMLQQRIDDSAQLARWLAADVALRQAAGAHDLPALDAALQRTASLAPSAQVLVVDSAGSRFAASPGFDWPDAALFAGDAREGRTRRGLSAAADCRLAAVAGAPLGSGAIVARDAYWFARGMTRPLRAMTEATKAMADGNLSAPLDISGTDEFAVLAQSFALMRAKLSDIHADLARERNRYRDFLAIMPHEFRTPLAALSASLELLEMDDTTFSPDQHALLNSLHRSVIRLKSLVDNLLDTASIQAGQFQVSTEPNNLAGIITEAREFTQPLLEQKGQALQVHIAPELPPVMADARRLTQVLINLISNANKYGPAGVPLRLGASPQEG